VQQYIRNVLWLVVVPALSFAADRREMTLGDAMRLAAKNNHDYAAALANARVVEAQANRAYGFILPEITAGGSLVHTSAPARFDMGMLAQGLGVYNPMIPYQSFNIIAQDSAYGNLNLTEILFTPQLFLLPAAKPGVEAANLGANEAREQVLLGVARVYLGLQGVVKLEAAARDAEQVALKHEKDMKGQVAAGTQGEIALLRAQTETAQARGVLAQLAGTRESLFATLESLLGEPVAPVAEITGLNDPTGPADEGQRPWEATYLVRATQRGVDAQEHFVFYDSLLWLPTLLASAHGGYNSNLGFYNTHFTYDFTLALNVPLYDRGLRYSMLHEDEAKLDGARHKLEGDRARAKANWISARANLDAAKIALEQAEAQEALATKAQKQMDGAFQLGLATAFELNDIDSKRFFAASQAAQTRAQLEVRKVEMMAAEGRLAHSVGLE
jgi:outer membrane protein TolC